LWEVYVIRAVHAVPFALAVIAVLLVGCGGSDSDPQPTSTATSAGVPTPATTRAAQPVGERMIDVGGHKLAIRCQGQAAPTVVYEAGAFPTTDEFADEIMDDVARDHRVCSYDRAGVGKSEPGPNPRDANQIATELDQLLTNAGETGPFVLVSWSVGALYTPLYAIAHPEDVAGYVFIDPRVSAYQLRVGSDPRLTAVAANLPPAYGEELRAWDQSATEVRDAGALPERPLIVLTAGAPAAIASADTREGGYNLWRSSHDDLAASVAGGKNIIVENAEHKIWAANPGAVLDAISEVAGG
jgi:pimeloyl-ACP methyl ester carboxylesterase